jgi:hypothetical protein
VPRGLKVNVDALNECLHRASPAPQGPPPTPLPAILPNNSIIGPPRIKVSLAVVFRTICITVPVAQKLSRIRTLEADTSDRLKRPKRHGTTKAAARTMPGRRVSS